MNKIKWDENSYEHNIIKHIYNTLWVNGFIFDTGKSEYNDTLKLKCG